MNANDGVKLLSVLATGGQSNQGRSVEKVGVLRVAAPCSAEVAAYLYSAPESVTDCHGVPVGFHQVAFYDGGTFEVVSLWRIEPRANQEKTPRSGTEAVGTQHQITAKQPDKT